MLREEVLEPFACCWEGLEDLRSGNVALHDFHELLVIALCCVLCGGQGAVDMAVFAEVKEPFLRSFLTLASLHWRLDVVMNENQDRIRMGRGPHNLAMLRLWPSTPCRKRNPKAPCAENSNAPGGTTTTSSASWSCFEMRLGMSPANSVSAQSFHSHCYQVN